MISVLYVDDEQMLLDLCKIFLERTGEFRVTVELSAREALDLLSGQEFDAIVSDYQMPGMDGIEFLKEIRKTGNTIPFIIFTGRGREEVAVAAFREGADFYLQKGGDPRSQFAELTNQIQQIVRQRRAESTVRESEEMYRTLFESAYDGIFLMEEATIIDCNQRAVQIYGRSRDEITGTTPMDLSPPVQPDGAESSVKARGYIDAAISGFPQTFEWRHTRGSAELFDAEISLNRIALGGRVLLIAFIRDITVRKQNEIELQKQSEELAASYEELLSAEEDLRVQYAVIARSEQALRESEERLNSVLSSIDDLVFTLDSDGVFLDTFHQTREDYYLPPVDFIGRSYHSFLPPAQAALLGQALDQVRQTGETRQITYSLPIRGEDRYYEGRISRRAGAGGQTAGFTLVARDVTEQRRAEEEFLASRATLDAIVQGSPIPQFVIDNAHRVTHWNAVLEQYSGIPAAGILGTDGHWRAFYPDKRPCLADLLLDGDSGAIREWYGEKVARSPLLSDAYTATDFFPDMGERGTWLSFTAALIRNADGEVIGAVETLEDISAQKMAEEELLSMTRFREGIIMNANVWLMVIDQEKKILVWNHAAEEMSGYRFDEVAGSSWIWRSLYPDPGYRRSITATIRKVIEEQEYLQDFQTTILTKDGEEKVILWNTRSLGDELHPDPRFVAIGVDITRTIGAQQALAASEARLQAIVSGSPIPQFVIDKKHRVIQWNAALEKHSRIPAERILGTDEHWKAFYAEKRPCLADLVIDENDAGIQALYPEQYEKSLLVEGGYQAVGFFPLMGEGGSWLFFTAAPIRDQDGGIIGAIETLEDITDRKKAEISLMESEEQFRALFNNANDAIFLHHLSEDGVPGKFIEVNETACSLLGYSRETLLTLSPPDVVSLPMREKSLEYSRLLLSQGHVSFEMVDITAGNEEIPVEITAHMYEFRGERMVLLNVRDISERKRYEDAIRNANQKLNLLSTITRHDILNQMTALVGYLDLLEETGSDLQLLDYISKAKKSAGTITRQILFTRDYQTIGIQSPQWQNLSETVSRAAGMLDTGMVRIEMDLEGIEIFADPLLEKVFFNLIDNSLRYARGLTRISIQAAYENAGMVLVYLDDGAGIPPEEKENIFLRKYFTNTGFGMFLSREILSITSLTIRETGEFGSGARFEIRVPKGSYRSVLKKKGVSGLSEPADDTGTHEPAYLNDEGPDGEE